MAVKAVQTITILKVLDIKTTRLYFKLVNAGSSAPEVPTTLTPASGSGWSTSEPSLDTGKDLYATTETIYSDDSFSYSGTESSGHIYATKYATYEAAKQAYNAAVNASNTINGYIESRETINGTQTVSTRFWEGETNLESIADGTEIIYWLPFPSKSETAGDTRAVGVDMRVNYNTTKAAGTLIKDFENSSSNVWLNLKLKNGTYTGWIPCYYGGSYTSNSQWYTNRLTTHYGGGSIIRFVYKVNAVIGAEADNNKYTGWFADANYDSNNYDRVRYNCNIKAHQMYLNSGRLLVGNDLGFIELGPGTSFNIDKPILYAGSAIGILGTGSNNYLMFSGIDLRNSLKNQLFKNADVTHTGAKWDRGTALSGTGTNKTGYAGTANDHYTNSSSGYVYVCTTTGTSSTAKWDYVKNTARVAGEKWYDGTALSGTGTNKTGVAGTVGDYYWNTSSGTYYKCVTTGTASTAKWDYQGILTRTMQTLYLKGSLNNNVFTPSDVPFTTEIPLQDDGLYYISIGQMYSVYQYGLFSEHPIYKFSDGQFRNIAYDADKKAVSQATTAPDDTTKIWLDLTTGKLKQYIDGEWVIINDYTGVTGNLQEQINDWNNALTEQANDLKDEITSQTTTMKETILQQTDEQFEMKFTTKTKTITDSIDAIQETLSETERYIRFDNGQITLGDAANPYTLKIENDKISIYYNGQRISTWDKTTFQATTLQAQDLELRRSDWQYKFAFIPRANGSLSFRKVSD